MGSTASQTALFGKLLKHAYTSPREGNYKGLRDVIVDMRALGATYNRINVPLTEDSVMGQRFAAQWAAEQVNYPELPPIEWQGRKNPDGLSSVQAKRARDAQPQADPDMRDRIDEFLSMDLGVAE